MSHQRKGRYPLSLQFKTSEIGRKKIHVVRGMGNGDLVSIEHSDSRAVNFQVTQRQVVK